MQIKLTTLFQAFNEIFLHSRKVKTTQDYTRSQPHLQVEIQLFLAESSKCIWYKLISTQMNIRKKADRTFLSCFECNQVDTIIFISPPCLCLSWATILQQETIWRMNDQKKYRSDILTFYMSSFVYCFLLSTYCHCHTKLSFLIK